MQKHSLRSINGTRREFLIKGFLVSAGALLGGRGFAADEAENHEHHHHGMNAGAVVTRSEVDIRVPQLKLIRDDGTTVEFPEEINDGRPILLSFIYTSCTTVCPLTSQVLSQIQKMPGLERLHMISISIDPEYDTPTRLSDYAKRYGAGPGWQHYTGTLEASIAIQKAFNAYHGDKMNHTPVTFLRRAPARPWIRLDGFASPEDVIHELQGQATGT